GGSAPTTKVSSPPRCGCSPAPVAGAVAPLALAGPLVVLAAGAPPAGAPEVLGFGLGSAGAEQPASKRPDSAAPRRAAPTRAAPASRPVWSISTSAASSTIAPRAVLIR